jgi:ubiquitin carboxyl-terminal hydrolase 31
MTSSRSVTSSKHPTKVKCSSTSKSSVMKFSNGYTPGVSGICNHGNSCFASGVVQCLSNTDLFAELFVTDYYRTQLLAAQRAGRVCIVTEKLAQLITSLWCGRYHDVLSQEFLDAVSKCSAVFAASKQSDAQEFLLWLLNCLKDELFGETEGEKSAPNHNNTSVRYLFMQWCEAC